jgi:hypothetical protein
MVEGFVATLRGFGIAISQNPGAFVVLCVIVLARFTVKDLFCGNHRFSRW